MFFFPFFFLSFLKLKMRFPSRIYSSALDRFVTTPVDVLEVSDPRFKAPLAGVGAVLESKMIDGEPLESFSQL